MAEVEPGYEYAVTGAGSKWLQVLNSRIEAFLNLAGTIDAHFKVLGCGVVHDGDFLRRPG